MTRRVIFSLVLMLSIALTNGQSSYDLPKVILPSPIALQFQKYGDYPGSNKTYMPPINIPLYTIKEGELELPISLSYHASGSKPSDINGLVGMDIDVCGQNYPNYYG